MQDHCLFLPLVLSLAIASSSYAQSNPEPPPVGGDFSTAPAATEESGNVQTAAAAVNAPLYISFQGYLEDDGSPATGTHDFVFRLKDFPTAGLTKWTESQHNVVVTDGIYNVLLGSASSLGNVDFNDELWLSIEVDGGDELLPRPQIVASPYSIMSLEALDLRLPAVISGTANVDGTKLLRITNNGTGDVLRVEGATASDGIEVDGADLHGILLTNIGGAALYASAPGGDGLYVSSPGDDGIDIQNPADNGIVVTNSGDFAFLFQDNPDVNTGSSRTSYVGLIQNTGTSTSEDVLALQTGSSGNVGVAANFIGFFNNEAVLVGQIEGNGSGGVAYNTSGADYAEYLPHLTRGESFAGGDVVGVFGGKVSRRTQGAQQVMVITDRPAVLGNARKGTEDVTDLEAVSFVGQVLVRAKGPVDKGDYLVASGFEDGTAVAVEPEHITLDDLSRLVGRAWETNKNLDTKRVNAVVGLDHSEVLSEIIKRQSLELARQEKAIEELRILLEQHMREHVGS
ncbi:MAG: hypothetical protein WBW88_08385 [Rhodothermales bacterium]